MLYNHNIIIDKSDLLCTIEEKGSAYMNAILGARIRKLRESKGFTQEQIAGQLRCTRQKYARMEKGLIDISYASINKIAQTLDIAVNDITSAISSLPLTQPMYRANGTSSQDDQFGLINNMINTFYTHRKLYESVRQNEDHD